MIIHNNHNLLLFLPARLAYDGEKPKEAQTAKPPETKPAPEKSADKVTPADLEAEKARANKQIDEAVQHPEIKAEAKKILNDRLGTYFSDINKLEADKQKTKAEVHAQVDSAVSDVLSRENIKTFNYITVDKKKFDYQPPLTQDRYAAEAAKAEASIKTMEGYKGTVPDFAKHNVRYVYSNGEVTMTIVKPGEKTGEKDNFEYHLVRINGNVITEEPRDTGKDKKVADSRDFQVKLAEWQSGAAPSFQYGDPPKTFPPEGLNMQEYLGNMNLKRSELTLDLLLRTREANIGSLDVNQKSVTTTVEWRNGKMVAVKTREESRNLLSNGGGAVEKDGEGRILREEKDVVQTVNRQQRMTHQVTEYWPQPSGVPLKIKMEETYRDGVITSRTTYDKKGGLERRETYVKDCEGVVAIDTPTGKMVQEIDEDGKPVVGFSGEPVMVPEVKREMRFKDANNHEVTIRTLAETNRERAGHRPPMAAMTPQEYMQFLAGNLQNEKQKAAFSNLMLHYRADEENTDHWQSGEETAQREYNGLLIGDCEDFAHFWHQINEMQGQKSYVLGLPNHAECITFSRNPDTQKITVTRSGTFGFHKEIQEFDTQQQALDYLTNNVYKSSVSNVEPLGDGRFYRPPKKGSTEAPKVTVLELRAEQKDEKERQKTPDVAITDLVVNAAPTPGRVAAGPAGNPPS